MPIRAELRHLYRTESYRAARQAAKERSGDRCERCGAPNHTIVLRAFEWWTPATLETTVFLMRGTIDGKEVTALPWRHKDVLQVSHFPRHDRMRFVGIQCGAAHLNGVAGDDLPENVAWLCRGCHLHHDKPFHRETRATRTDRARPILQKAQEPYQVSLEEVL